MAILQLMKMKDITTLFKVDFYKAKDIISHLEIKRKKGCIKYYDRDEVTNAFEKFWSQERNQLENTEWLSINTIIKNYTLLSKNQIVAWIHRSNFKIRTRKKKSGYILRNRKDMETMFKAIMMKLEDVLYEANVTEEEYYKFLKDMNYNETIIDNQKYVHPDACRKIGVPLNTRKKYISLTHKDMNTNGKIFFPETIKINGNVTTIFPNKTFLFFNTDDKSTLDCKLAKGLKSNINTITKIEGNFIFFNDEKIRLRPTFYIIKILKE